MENIKLLVLAAGKGERLRPLTKNIPKGMVKIKNTTLIKNIILNARKNNIRDIDILTGYKKSKIDFKSVNYIHNRLYHKTNMLYSFYIALNSYKKIDFDLIISYSDIIYNYSVLNKIIHSKETISVVVDTVWKKYWKKRFEDPLLDAESCVIKKNRIIEIGKPIKNFKKSKYQYIGLIKIKKNILIQIKKELFNNVDNIKELNLRKDYFTDLLNYLICLDYSIHPLKIKKGWLEIDNIRDYEIANKNIILKNNIVQVIR